MEAETWERTRKGAQERRGEEEKMSQGTNTVIFYVKSRLLGGVRMERTAIPQPPLLLPVFPH